jgi:ABC-type transport system involved in multi-copper enzyme maturation permease subunit
VTQGQILLGLLFGSIGLAFFMYGKKQQRAVPLVCGIALMVYPYFVPSTMWLIVVGVALCALPYFYRP